MTQELRTMDSIEEADMGEEITDNKTFGTSLSEVFDHALAQGKVSVDLLNDEDDTNSSLPAQASSGEENKGTAGGNPDIDPRIHSKENHRPYYIHVEDFITTLESMTNHEDVIEYLTSHGGYDRFVLIGDNDRPIPRMSFERQRILDRIEGKIDEEIRKRNLRYPNGFVDLVAEHIPQDDPETDLVDPKTLNTNRSGDLEASDRRPKFTPPDRRQKNNKPRPSAKQLDELSERYEDGEATRNAPDQRSNGDRSTRQPQSVVEQETSIPEELPPISFELVDSFKSLKELKDYLRDTSTEDIEHAHIPHALTRMVDIVEAVEKGYPAPIEAITTECGLRNKVWDLIVAETGREPYSIARAEEHVEILHQLENKSEAKENDHTPKIEPSQEHKSDRFLLREVDRTTSSAQEIAPGISTKDFVKGLEQYTASQKKLRSRTDTTSPQVETKKRGFFSKFRRMFNPSSTTIATNNTPIEIPKSLRFLGRVVSAPFRFLKDLFNKE